MNYQSGEVSKLLNIPPSSLRRYVSLFGDHLSQDAQLKRGRRFTDNDLATIAQIRDLAAQGHKLDDIGSMLGEVIAGDFTPEDTTALALPNVAKQIKAQEQKTDDHEGRLQALEDQIAQLRDELATEKDRSLLDRILGRRSEKKPPE